MRIEKRKGDPCRPNRKAALSVLFNLMKVLALISVILTLIVPAWFARPLEEPVVEQVRVLRGFRGFAAALAYSRDGALLASAGQDGIVRLWDTRDWKQKVLADYGHASLAALAFSPTDDAVVVGGAGVFSVLEAPDWRETELTGAGDVDITTLSFNREGSRLAVGANDGSILLYNSATWQRAGGEAMLRSLICDLAELSGERIVAATEDGAARILRVPDFRVVRTYRHRGGLASMAVSRTGATTVTGGIDGISRVWETATGKHVRSLSGHPESIHAATFSPDNSRLALGSGDGTVSIWNTAVWKRERLITGLDSVTALAWSPDSATLATAGWDKTIRIWRIRP